MWRFVQYTKPDVATVSVLAALERGAHVVIDTSGLTDRDHAEVDVAAKRVEWGVLAVGNFALTVVLMQKFAEMAAKRIPRELRPNVRGRLDQIDAVTKLEDLKVPPGNRLHTGRMNIPFQRLNAIVKGRRAVSADTALLLESLTGWDAHIWLTLQWKWDLGHAMRARGRRPKVRPPC